jgi:hypothetical protein
MNEMEMTMLDMEFIFGLEVFIEVLYEAPPFLLRKTRKLEVVSS